MAEIAEPKKDVAKFDHNKCVIVDDPFCCCNLSSDGRNKTIKPALLLVVMCPRYWSAMTSGERQITR